MDHNKLRKIYKKHSDEIEEKFFHLLIDSGADLEALNGDGDTALMMAISNVCVTISSLMYIKAACLLIAV